MTTARWLAPRAVPGTDQAVSPDATRFLAEASHELRGGAARLALMAEAIAEQAAVSNAGAGSPLPPRLLDLAAEGRRVQALASALLDVVQLAEEGRRLDTVPVRVAAVVDDVLAGEQARPDQTVDLRVADDLSVMADPLALHQILSNLVRNAYRHGGRRVTVEARSEGGDGALVVTDNGAGVPDDRAGHLFDPYRRGIGDGLGLSIASQLVALLHGEISYESNVVGGARFVVRLPLATPQPAT